MEDVAKSPLVTVLSHRDLVFFESQTYFQLASLRLVDGPRGCRRVMRLPLWWVLVSVPQTDVKRSHRPIQLHQLDARRTPQTVVWTRWRVAELVGSVEMRTDTGREEGDAATALGRDRPAAVDVSTPGDRAGGAGQSPRSRVESDVAARRDQTGGVQSTTVVSERYCQWHHTGQGSLQHKPTTCLHKNIQ